VPRIRSIKADLVRREQFGDVSAGATACYLGLQPHADDTGHYRYHPRLVKADVFPMHVRVGEGHIEEWIDELLEPGLVCRYVVGERMYLHFPDWDDLQRVDKPSASFIPPCPREPHGVLARSSEPSREFARRSEESGALDPRARRAPARVPEVEVEVEVEGKDQELPPDGGTSAPNNGALVPQRSARAAQAALGVVERLKASVDSGRRSWSFSAAVKAEWDALLDDDGNLSAARDFLVWFMAEMRGEPADRRDWQMAMQKVKRYRARALYGVEQAVTRVHGEEDRMAFWRYVEAVCQQAQARSEGST
jgi:hypothetical protein